MTPTASPLVRIQHRAGREWSLERLLENLSPAIEIVKDDGPDLNPWRGYKLCLENLPEEGHVCVIQDDTLVCKDFEKVLGLVADANPDEMVTLFLSKVPRRTVHRATVALGKSRYVYCHPGDLVHVVGLLWPVGVAREFMEWATTDPVVIRGSARSVSDDAHVTRWTRLKKKPVRATVPSIVQHPDDVESLVNANRVAYGRDSGRTAAIWIGDEDPLDLDWSS